MRKLLQSRNNRLMYYIKAYAREIYPKSLLKIDLDKLQKSILNFNEKEMYTRLNYYNKLTENFDIDSTIGSISDMYNKEHGLYFFDLIEYTRFFPQENKLSYLFGDITTVPNIPTIVKSRPIINNTNSILINMDKLRHFYFVKNDVKFRDKNNKLIWRGGVYQAHRIKFMQEFFKKSDLIDVGDFRKNKNEYTPWRVPFMSIREQLQNKFVLAIEGTDVATNTKWIMSSNSLCFMTKPKYETWFMEGSLIPNYHYVLINDDYSNLEERIDYYIRNPNEAENILHNANNYIEKFKNKESEDWLHLKVLEKYFKSSSQL